jgi:hypothetical protein
MTNWPRQISPNTCFAKYLALNPAGKETLTARIDAAKKQREEMKKQGAVK